MYHSEVNKVAVRFLTELEKKSVVPNAADEIHIPILFSLVDHQGRYLAGVKRDGTHVWGGHQFALTIPEHELEIRQSRLAFVALPVYAGVIG